MGESAARRTAFAGALVAVALLGDSYLYAVLPLYHAEAGVTLVAVGWLLSVNRWVRLITNPLAGAVGVRWGWSAAFAGALWLGAATTAGYGLLKGFWLLLAARCLWGLVWSFLRLGGMAAVLADSPPGRHGRQMGLFIGIARLGSLVGVVAGGLLADRLGFAHTALLLGSATAAGAALGTLPPAVGGRWGAPGRAAGAPPVPNGLRHRWVPAGGPEWGACLTVATLHMVISGLVTSTVSLLVRERIGDAVAVGPWLLGAAAVGGLLLGTRWILDLALGPAVGHWSDQHGRGAALAAAMVVMVVCLVGLSRATGLVQLALWTTILFGAGTAAAVALDARAGDLAGREAGRFLPLYNTWLDLGAAAGPILGYAAVSRYGLGAVYVGAGAALLAAWALGERLHRR